jgi:hypothetical protein
MVAVLLADLLLKALDPRLQRFYADWDKSRKGRRFPAYGDLAPADLGDILGYLTVIEVQHNPLSFRFRLHGAELVRHGGYDMTGKEISELPGEENRRAFLERLHYLVESRQPQIVRSRRMLDGRMIRYDALWVPLSDDGETINMLLRALVYRDLPPPDGDESYYESALLP